MRSGYTPRQRETASAARHRRADICSPPPPQPTLTPEYHGRRPPNRRVVGAGPRAVRRTAEGWRPVREMRVMAVGLESEALRPVLVLQEASGDHRLLPVWIGTAEANAITAEQQHVSLPRPITHQLIGDVLEALGRRLEQVRITEVRDNVNARAQLKVNFAVNSLIRTTDYPVKAA